MAVQKNFIVKNGIEVNDNLIFADKDQNTVGIGTTTTPEKLQVNGGIGATSIVVTGVGTIPTLNSTNALVSNGYINVGVVTTLSGTLSTYTTSNSTTLNATTGNIVTGVVTTVSGTNLTYTNGNITTLNGGTVLTPNLYAVSGIVTNGTVTNLTGTAATIGTVQIAAGIVTSSSGIVTYYGDGTYLSLASNPATGIGIGTTGGIVGYGVTFLDLKGAGISTTLYNDSVGIATIFFEGGGGGGGAIGIGSTFPGTPLSLDLPPSNGDLFFHIDYARTFIYYDESVLGVGSSAFWIDASPFNQGLVATLAGVAFSMGSSSNPSAYFEGYPTTGWFSPTAGQFGIVSVGNTILAANPNGIVVTGIASATGFAGTFSGTSAVFSGNSTDNIVRITQTGTGNALVVEDSTNPDTTPFVITGIGSVGIGTNAPINHLDVHGTIRAGRQDAVSSGGEIVFARASDNTNAWALDVEGNDFRVTDSSQGQTRIHIGAGGNVGLGSTATSRLHVFGNANITGVTTFGTSSVTIDGNTNNVTLGTGVTISGATSNVFTLSTNGSERVRVDSSGRALFGTSSAPSTGGWNQYAKIVNQGNTGGAANGGVLAMNRGIAATSMVADQQLGVISFGDSAGNEFGTIICSADAQPGNNDYPGRLVFSTTADGASSPTERMRITSSGVIQLSNGSFSSSAGYGLALDSTGTSGVLVRANSGVGVQLTNGATAWTSFTSESRLKNIVGDVDRNQAWDLVRSIELKRYYYKDQDDQTGIPYMGPMADWLEQQDPELVIYNEPDEEGPVRTYNQAVLDMKSLAALQLALKRIEALEAEVAALKAQ